MLERLYRIPPALPVGAAICLGLYLLIGSVNDLRNAPPPEPPVLAGAENKLGFMLLGPSDSELILYEAIRGTVRVVSPGSGAIRFVNTEGVERTWRGTWLYSPQPLVLRSEPAISSQTGALFKKD